LSKGLKTQILKHKTIFNTLRAYTITEVVDDAKFSSTNATVFSIFTLLLYTRQDRYGAPSISCIIGRTMR
jgi:hypothetical protein